MANITLTFKPKSTTKKLLSVLKDRSKDVLTKRYGLDDGERKTLQAIGNEYNITRERVRQIENFALKAIRKSDSFAEARAIFDELKENIYNLGGIVHEDHLLQKFAKDKVSQNHINLYLTLGDDFTKHKEDKNFKSRWSIDDVITNKVHTILEKLHEMLEDHDLKEEDEMVSHFLDHAEGHDLPEEHRRDDVARRLLWMSKVIAQNPLGHWGKAASPNIKVRGVRDLAYLVMRSHGSPMHFREVAAAISETFGRPTHTATCHNELIKDERFVLIGRGLYGLKEWGYTPGTAREVIEQVLKEADAPLSREEVIERVMKERYLKKNTILVNLQNPKHFKKDASGLYTIK